jgi:hypothetical protein
MDCDGLGTRSPPGPDLPRSPSEVLPERDGDQRRRPVAVPLSPGGHGR